jgi:formylmethanofuran dehydrogenase subunit E
MNIITSKEQAARLARAVVSDVAIYNQEKVEKGIKNDNIFETLSEEIEEGRQHFYSRVAPELNPEQIFDLTQVDILIKRAGKIESTIW